MIPLRMSELPPVYAIYDHPHPYLSDAAAVVGRLVAGGVRRVQLRAKQAARQERIALARSLAKVCGRHGASLWLNDDLEAALLLGDAVEGVHLGQTDLDGLDDEGRRRLARVGCGLGISTHSLEELAAALELEPDYLGFGPVFETASKGNPDPVVGLDGLQTACARASVPVVAIGGIDPGNAAACLHAGADSVAVISALVDETLEGIEAKSRMLVGTCRSALAPR